MHGLPQEHGGPRCAERRHPGVAVARGVEDAVGLGPRPRDLLEALDRGDEREVERGASELRVWIESRHKLLRPFLEAVRVLELGEEGVRSRPHEYEAGLGRERTDVESEHARNLGHCLVARSVVGAGRGDGDNCCVAEVREFEERGRGARVDATVFPEDALQHHLSCGGRVRVPGEHARGSARATADDRRRVATESVRSLLQPNRADEFPRGRVNPGDEPGAHAERGMRWHRDHLARGLDRAHHAPLIE